MKKITAYLFIIVLFFNFNCALSAKARNIKTEADFQFHYSHLFNHLGSNTCYGTGNYLKVRIKPEPSKVLGHLEQADKFILSELNNGFAKVEIIYSDKTSPDSYVGLSGWVDANYINCTCNDYEYKNNIVQNEYDTQYDFIEVDNELPFNTIKKFWFSSGAGAWGTSLNINKDGVFEGEFHDSDMGDTGEGYSNGTEYFCKFNGSFADISKINDYSYSMYIKNLQTSKKEKYIKDGILYIGMEPYGVEGGNEFKIYMPNTPINSLSEEFLSWYNGLGELVPGGVLGTFAAENVNTQEVFFEYEWNYQ
ncbi:MAG: hypothetical protein GYA87_00750 [Christensenellaceae bacterium]|nr:hypothetical protein [Christensenellaceae bacterium]